MNDLKPQAFVYDDRSKEQTLYPVTQVLGKYNDKLFVLLDDGDVGIADLDQQTFISEDKNCGWIIENGEF